MSSKQSKTSKKKSVKKAIKTIAKVERKLIKKPSIGRSLMTGAGRFIGGLVGAGEVGASAGNAFAHFLGMGAYTVNSNSIMTNSQQAPVFNGDDGSIILSHSELITDVIGSVAFNSRSFMIDPTNLTTFPYLAGLARNFEQYEFLGLVYTYKPTSGSAIASTNNSLGTVMLATEYDVSRRRFSNKLELESYQFSTSTEPSSVMYHPVECNPKKDILNSRYVAGPWRTQRASTLTDGLSALKVQNNLQFLGRTQLATVGMQAAVTVGELWVSYKVKLSVPRIPGPSQFQGLFHICSDVALPIGAATAYGSSYKLIADSSASFAPMAVTVNGTDTRIGTTGLPLGTKIILFLYVSVSGGTVASGAITLSAGLTLRAFWNIDSGGSGTTGIFTAASGQDKFMYAVSFEVVDNTVDSYVTIPVPTIATATATWDIHAYVVSDKQDVSVGHILTADEMQDDRDFKIQLLTDKLEKLAKMEYEVPQGISIQVTETEEKTPFPSCSSTPAASGGWTLMRK